MARTPFAHRREQVEDQLDRGEVVELHRPLVVVEAVVSAVDRAADRLAGVVDEDVHRLVLLEHLGAHAVDVVGVGQVARVHVGDAAELVDLVCHLLELVRAAGDEQHRPAGLSDLERGRLADPRRRAGDHHGPSADRVLERAREHVARSGDALPERPQRPDSVGGDV